jgi:hypothetical protein
MAKQSENSRTAKEPANLALVASENATRDTAGLDIRPEALGSLLTAAIETLGTERRRQAAAMLAELSCPEDIVHSPKVGESSDDHVKALKDLIVQAIAERDRDPENAPRYEAAIENLSGLLAVAVHSRAQDSEPLLGRVIEYFSDSHEAGSTREDVTKTSFADLLQEWHNEASKSAQRGRLDEENDSLRLPATAVKRLEQLTEFAKKHGDEGLAEQARLLFPEWGISENSAARSTQSRELPTEAPEIYQGLRGPETPPQFVQRVYGEWLGHGLTRAHIRNLDPKLYTAIDNWLKKPGCEWPADVDLPTLKEQNSRWAERVQSEGLANVLGDASPSFALKEAARLNGVLQRRREKQ